VTVVKRGAVFLAFVAATILADGLAGLAMVGCGHHYNPGCVLIVERGPSGLSVREACGHGHQGGPRQR
jgi:hypothetical protein